MKPQPVDGERLREFRLDARVAFITGATGHLGRVMSEALASAGAHVIVNSRNTGAVQALCAELRAKGHSVSTAAFDVTDEPAVKRNIAEIAATHGRLDIIVNNASAGRPGTIESATREDFEQLYRVNVIAAFQILQSAIPLLKKAAMQTKGSSVVNVSSMYGSVSPDPSIYGASGANNPPYYGAAKAALIQMTRYAACHLAADGIRVNCISPGPFPAARYVENDHSFRERLNNKVPMGRIGEPRELCGPLLFLASDASSYVTGINLAVDGGWTAW
jgi:NAD(P)-dependent dehydrogenase (short-subunit alcohol dehydrogenase family)